MHTVWCAHWSTSDLHVRQCSTFLSFLSDSERFSSLHRDLSLVKSISTPLSRAVATSSPFFRHRLFLTQLMMKPALLTHSVACLAVCMWSPKEDFLFCSPLLLLELVEPQPLPKPLPPYLHLCGIGLFLFHSWSVTSGCQLKILRGIRTPH